MPTVPPARPPDLPRHEDRKTDNLQHAIAKQLADSNVGLFRAQLRSKISPALHEGDANKISSALNAMLKAGHVSKSARMGMDGSRWSLTPQGRAAYSVLHYDASEPASSNAQNSDSTEIDTMPTIKETEPADTTETIQTAATGKTDPAGQALLLDPAYEIDAAIIALVNKIHAIAGPTIERKTEKLQLLESLENTPLIANDARVLLFGIRMDIQQLEATS
jgi:hypothetical protein